MKIILTEQQKRALEDRHRTARDSRECDRIKAVLLASEGWSAVMISQALRINETTVVRHLNDYQVREKLCPQNGASVSRLSAEQTEELITHLTQHTYHHTHQIVCYIATRYSVQYTVAGLHKWLTRNGFSYKQPKGVPHKFDVAKQQAFIESYEQLKTELDENERILFMDAVHPTQATKVSYGWLRKGQDKAIETTGSRSRINVVGAVNLSDIGATVTEDYEQVNGESIADFFGKLRASYSEQSRLHIVLDDAGYHRSDMVKRAATTYNIQLHYLPPYSPNLNPIERLWKVMNEYARNNRYFKSTKDFRQEIRQFFEKTLPDIADNLYTRINDNFEVLKPAPSG